MKQMECTYTKSRVTASGVTLGARIRQAYSRVPDRVLGTPQRGGQQ